MARRFGYPRVALAWGCGGDPKTEDVKAPVWCLADHAGVAGILYD